MQIRVFILLSLIIVVFPVLAQDNPELAELYELDQTARKPQNIDWDEVNKEDASRRESVISILRAGGLKTAKDFFNAAMIFQHGNTSDDIRLAHSFATLASTLDAELPNANWLKAASWDRLLLNFAQPQWYGTQYIRDDSGNVVLYEVKSDVISDEQRVAWSVPTLAESRVRAEARNNAK